MFAVKEYTKEGFYIGHTEMNNSEDAIILAVKSEKTKKNIQVFVTEVDYDDRGDLYEIILYPKEKIGERGFIERDLVSEMAREADKEKS